MFLRMWGIFSESWPLKAHCHVQIASCFPWIKKGWYSLKYRQKGDEANLVIYKCEALLSLVQPWLLFTIILCVFLQLFRIIFLLTDSFLTLLFMSRRDMMLMYLMVGKFFMYLSCQLLYVYVKIISVTGDTIPILAGTRDYV